MYCLQAHDRVNPALFRADGFYIPSIVHATTGIPTCFSINSYTYIYIISQHFPYSLVHGIAIWRCCGVTGNKVCRRHVCGVSPAKCPGTQVADPGNGPYIARRSAADTPLHIHTSNRLADIFQICQLLIKTNRQLSCNKIKILRGEDIKVLVTQNISGSLEL